MTNTNFNLDDLLSGTGISTRQESASELLDKFGLNWTVSKRGLNLPDGTSSGFFGIVRDDTNTTFATCKEGYEPYQNGELAELINKCAGNLGLSIDRGGMFKKGALVYLQLATGVIASLGANKDVVKKFITGMIGHDGSLSLSWGMSNITISCQNSFWTASKELKNKVKHTQTMRNRIDEIMGEIEVIQNEEKKLYEIYFKLAEVPAEKRHIESLVKIALDIDMNGTKTSLTGYQANRLNELSRSINSEMEQKGETLWGLFSGLTHYTTHIMPGGSENRRQSKAIGAGFKVDNEVFENFAALVK